MAGPGAPAGGRGNEARNQISTIIEKIVVPARCRNILARMSDADDDAARPRQLVVRQFQHEGRRRVVAPEKVFGEERHAERADDAGGVEAEHHQPLQADEAPHLPWPE